MARQLLSGAVPHLDANLLRARSNAPKISLAPHLLEARLRQQRSPAYVQAMARLDAGGHCCTRDAVEALIRQIELEMPEIVTSDLPIAILAECFLGSPYEVHTLDCVGQIVTHYKSHEVLPANLERGRALALHPAYAFVEIYPHKVIPVTATGIVSISGGQREY